MNTQLQIVVAYYNHLDFFESIKYINYSECIIYNKSSNNILLHDKIVYIPDSKISTIESLENIGREGETYLHHIIKNYDRDDAFPFFPTDVYSFHADRSPIPTDTFLCTYHGASSEIIPNSQATQKIRIPEIRAELKKLYGKGFKILFDLAYSNHNIIVADHLIKFDLRRNNKSKMNLKVIYHLIISIIKKIVFKLT